MLWMLGNQAQKATMHWAKSSTFVLRIADDVGNTPSCSIISWIRRIV